MTDQIKFLHCADLHIDSPFKGIGELPSMIEQQIRDSTFTALQSLVEQAIVHQVDFILIAGDLFDHEVRSLKAQIRLRDAFQMLDEHGIEVFVSHGNHDYLSAVFHPVEYPENVHLFTEPHVTNQSFYKNGEPAAVVYGFSYHHRAVKERKAAEFRRIDEGKYHIAMLHGSIETNSDHDVYAPFRVRELKEQDMDYWALGHIHKREILSEAPYIVYPGNIQGRSIKETGEKGCYLVEMDPASTTLTFLPLHTFQFYNITLETEADSFNGLEKFLAAKMEQWRQTGPAIIHLHLTGGEELAALWHNKNDIAALLEWLNEQEQAESQWVWIRDITLDVMPSWNEKDLKQEKHFVGEVLRQYEALGDMEAWLDPLYRHRTARKYLDRMSDDEKKQVLKEAKDLVLMELLK
ncbi:DNA repair exonuclease SbcCD nuclease subunit [Thalassobacillus cyri]|uniref:DNA repair exonuclease SbcCD nuclease subunit n=1 Tax=Thalassobacillus cyri TaxID=571932 RepID=A0A1H4GJV7_9BACI|nr:DNA repair exonuclease [Thalassobacillus cyri]SEB09270.1 DNA repair exonuclease SbcCD nuclease subunit [Thalassobacillus cyri]